MKTAKNLSLASIEYQYYFECECEDGHAFLNSPVTEGESIMCETCLTWHRVTKESLENK